jgi:hypothetical protein
MRETTNSNMNSDLHQSAYGTFMNNTPITPGHPNMNFTSTADKKLKKVTTNEDPAYNLNSVQSEFSLKNNQIEN